MSLINIFLKISFSILFAVAIINCSKRNNPECESIKIRLLLEDIFNKRYLYSAFKDLWPQDSSSSFNYLYLENLDIPDEIFYLHRTPILNPTYPDSVMLRIIHDNDLIEKYANQVSISLLETNKDTTTIKINVGYSTPQNRLKSEATFSYFFDTTKCKWIVLDSTFWQY